VRLDLSCARRGVDVQVLTAKTRPMGPVGYNTIYSDGSYKGDGSSDYSGGSTPPDHPFADDTGAFRASWTVPENAPTGLARVRGSTAEGQFELTFNIVAKDGRCG
jgi:hypothetical protein